MVDFFDFVVLSSIVIILPLINDFLNNTFPNAKIGRIASEIVGSILVLFIFHLVIVGVWLWYTYYLPYYYTKESIYSLGSLNIFDIASKLVNSSLDTTSTTSESSIKISIILQSIYLFIVVINIYYYFYYSIIADNYLPQLNKTKQDKLTQDQRDNNLCSQCTLYSKDKWSSLHIDSKSFHCKICKRCTNAMDHHCPFINNCVGKNNHHYFYLFLVYTYLAMIYACFLTYYPFMDCVYNKSSSSSSSSSSPSSLSTQDIINKQQICQRMDKYSYIFLCCLIVITAINGVLFFQTYLLFTNSKTVQLLRKLKKSKTYLEWFKWLINNFNSNFNINNFKSIFTGWKLYNIIIPYNKIN